MFGLLNPALTPLKTKITLIVVGLLLTMMLGSLAASGVIFRMYKGAQVKIGALTEQVASVEQLNIDNQVAWGLKQGNYERQLLDKDTLRQQAEQAATEAKQREARYDRQLAAALKKLKESTDANVEASEWAIVPVPAAVISGMCAAAKEAVGEAAACGDHEDGTGGGARIPDGAVPSPTAT